MSKKENKKKEVVEPELQSPAESERELLLQALEDEQKILGEIEDEDVGILLDDNSEMLVDAVLEQIEEKDFKKLKNTLAVLEEEELLFLFSRLTVRQEGIVFRLLNKDHALHIFEHLDTNIQKDVLKSLSDERTREIVEELDPDDRVELLDELPAAVAHRLINLLSPEERKTTYDIMGYSQGSAGRIMTPEFISLAKEMSASEALAKVRHQAKGDNKETVYTLFVTEKDKTLIGVLSLKDLVIAEPTQLIDDIMTTKVVKATTNTEEKEAAGALKEFDLLAIPVVDNEDRIVGIITIDDAVDILEEEATDSIYNKAGLANIKKSDTNRSNVLVRGSIWKVWAVRLPFLLLTLVMGIVSGLIMSGFEAVLATVPIAMIFLPMVMDLGGSVGNQSSTIFVRGTALGQIDTKRFGRHLLRELRNGLTMGVIIGMLAGGAATLIGHFGIFAFEPVGWVLGPAVGISIIIVMLFATLLGFLVPFTLTKMKLDNAAGASPIITALKDITGITIYFLFVSLFFRLFS